MNLKPCFTLLAASLWLMISLPSCKPGHSKAETKKFNYATFKDALQKDTTGVKYDTSNIFDSKIFTPGIDTLDTLLKRIDTLWHREVALMEQMDTMISRIKREELFTPEEKAEIKENVRRLDSFLLTKDTLPKSSCTGKDCLIYAEIIKSTQTLYLYIEGELKDSFKVSTGVKNYETPQLNVRPSGPIFTKYTSKKFPGGNYKGLGNMPYAVFVRGGYAIHGTTPGNFSKLGNRASHGCIRLHPDNARIFYELVKLIGLDHTWVTIRNTEPVEAE